MDPRTQSQYDVRRAAFAGGGSGGNDEMMTEGEGGSKPMKLELRNL